MMFILCQTCRFGIRVTGDPEDERSLIGDRSPHHRNYKCPECKGECVAGPFADNDVLQEKNLRDLKPMEAHLLFEGMGYPEERDCVAEIVSQELTSKRAKKVHAYTLPGTARTVLDAIELEDGTTLFLSGCASGALVYRIRKPKPYASKVEE